MFLSRNKNKQSRFRKTEFQEKLERARGFQRKSSSQPVVRSRKTRWLAILFLILIFYYLAISNRFLVQDTVLRDDSLAQADVNRVLRAMAGSRVALFVPSNHFLVFNQKRLLAAVQNEFPEIRSISYFHKVFPNRVEIGLEKRQALYVWKSGSEYY